MPQVSKNTYAVDGIPTQSAPEAVCDGRRRIQKATRTSGGDLILGFSAANYRTIDTFESAGSQVQTGSLDGAEAALSDARVRQLASVAVWLAASGTLAMSRIAYDTAHFFPVEVAVELRTNPGYLSYLPEDNVRLTRKDNRFASAFTTGTLITSPKQAAVSFVGVSPDDFLTNKQAAATEIIQNRLAVTGVTLDTGQSLRKPHATEPYQETIANGLGNMIGLIEMGQTYKDYRKYVREVITPDLPLFGNETEGIYLIAPHTVFPKNVYEQLADGAVPDTMPRLLPVHPHA